MYFQFTKSLLKPVPCSFGISTSFETQNTYLLFFCYSISKLLRFLKLYNLYGSYCLFCLLKKSKCSPIIDIYLWYFFSLREIRILSFNIQSLTINPSRHLYNVNIQIYKDIYILVLIKYFLQNYTYCENILRYIKLVRYVLYNTICATYTINPK